MAKLIRFPGDVEKKLERAAVARGVSENSLVVLAVCAYLDLGERSSSMESFIASIAESVELEYGTSSFPDDVIRRQFEKIRDDTKQRGQYEALIMRSGRIDKHARQRVHQQIGRAVKRALRADVVGRLGPFNPETELIRSCAKLRPRGR
jgi:hypothetical protein